jgi:hypothetical protein
MDPAIMPEVPPELMQVKVPALGKFPLYQVILAFEFDITIVEERMTPLSSIIVGKYRSFR